MKQIGRLFGGIALTGFVTFAVYFIHPWIGAAASAAVFTMYWKATGPIRRE